MVAIGITAIITWGIVTIVKLCTRTQREPDQDDWYEPGPFLG